MRSDIAKSASRSAILEPNCKHNSFSPEVLRQLCMVQDGTNAFKEAAVERLRHPVMLRSVVCRETAFSALLLQELREVTASVLATAVRTKSLNSRAMLSTSPRDERLVRVQSLILALEQLEVGVTSMVISKSNIILAPTER